MSEDQLEKWIRQRDRESEIRSRIIPASTDRLASENPGDGETAMDTIAAWLGEYAQLPLVELARITPSSVTLTFSEEAILPEPWVSRIGDQYAPHDQWGIALHDALELPRSEQYGWQVSGLTALGTLADGSRGLINTCRWEILQIVGTPQWTRNLILTQVMNQAAEPWSIEHDIWLIGFESTAEKLVSFLAKEHPLHRFHTANSLKDLESGDLQDSTATLYVMDADRETELQFQALQTSGVGLVADTIITDEAMFLTEREGGRAVLGPFRENLEIWPNLSSALIEKMEQAWRATEELAKQKAAETDFNAFLTQQAEEDFESAEEARQVDLVDEILEKETEGNLEDDCSEREPSDPLGQQGQVTATEVDDETPVAAFEEQAPASPEESPQTSHEPKLQLLGNTKVVTPEGELTDRHAALLAILKISQEPVPPQQISELLWPGDEAQGQTARTRRSRLLSKVRQHLGEIVQIDEEGWVLQQDKLPSDMEVLLNTLTNTPLTEADLLIRACQEMGTPLAGTAPWAEAFRATLTEELTNALHSLKNRAVEAEAYDIAKAAKTALHHLGEG